MTRLCVVIALVLAGTGNANADVIERGHVITIEANEIYFSVGADKKPHAGARIRFKRTIKLSHPVTAKPVVDWLPLGRGTITMVGKQMSMARVPAKLAGSLRRGDIVEVLVARKETPAPTPTPAAPTAPAPTVAPTTAGVLAVWQRTTGQSLQARIIAWRTYLQHHPASPHAAAVRGHIDGLRKYREKVQPRELRVERTSIPGLRHNAPSRGALNKPIDLVFLIERPADLVSAWLHYRPAGTNTYRRGLLQRHHGTYLRGTIPAAAVVSPGVEYFVEVATRGGDVGAAINSANEPRSISVDKQTLGALFEQPRNRSRISVTTTYLDFATFDGRSGVRTDQFVLFEADFFYRLRKRIYGVRVGYGSFNGRGGYANRDFTDQGDAPEAGFNYGYAEVEIRANSYTSVMGRLIAGIGREGYGMGVAARARIGAEERTNLTLSASTIAEIGFLSELRMQWNAIDDVPLGLGVGLTDQPNRGDLGVRLTTSIGWRATPWFRPTLNLSYQARTVVHSGVGAGLGMVFDW